MKPTEDGWYLARMKAALYGGPAPLEVVQAYPRKVSMGQSVVWRIGDERVWGLKDWTFYRKISMHLPRKR